MTTYVISIPGTFLREPDESARAAVVRRLRPADPHHTSLGQSEDLDILTVNDNGTFSIRLEVDADDSRSAETHAKEVAAAALREAGLSEDEAPLGPTAVTGIDT
ncbi:hypothetical protein AR457_03395 [Streptomyces agglomeratus]|uniref:Uncharacterized protein n=1 Tax=Streptomyces agglomeratus TaxID=285458 RepID=A0A1E5P2E5_9ACTN|nr:hypothetical protein [Streptomyces agglomeratus]OEJ23682.1 hypothetical protein AS594_03500 [Streptomyces agglomeratus]OEJ43274.1 hypothetical protein AR457_03395 [Streptomyces agglomeratus]OEJ54807.1 hypothetical protein BGK72_32375 [Streptomyces agglomeratus]OEJ62179.1 hypothetical protein BGM19_33285 [Streptomyces agglomeratus]